MKINIFDYPDIFKPFSQKAVTPYQTYYLKVRMHGEVKEIFWHDKSLDKTSESVRLRELINQIRIIVEEKEKFKKLPNPTGSYL